MGNDAHAMISWVPAEKGGRRQLPSGPSYATVVRFDDDDSWPAQAWSLRVEFVRSFADAHFLHARVSFLSEDAPVERLHSGSRFQLYEGKRVVAMGLVREGAEVPSEQAEFETALLS